MQTTITVLTVALPVVLGLLVWWDMRKVNLNPDEPHGFR